MSRAAGEEDVVSVAQRHTPPGGEGAASPGGEELAALPEGEEDAVGALLVLTPTELEVLETTHLSGLSDPGGADPPDADEVSGAVRVEAVRSLTARGLLGPDGGIDETTAAGRLAATVLDVRLGADTVVVAERLVQATGADGGAEGGSDGGTGPGPEDRPAMRAVPEPGPRRDVRILHLLPVGAVVEDVHAEGVHGFDLLLEPDRLVDCVTDMLVPPDAAEVAAPAVVEVGPDRAQQLPDLLGRPTVLAEITRSTADGRTEGHLVALGPGGCWAAPGGPGPLRFTAVPPDWVARTVTGWVARTLSGRPSRHGTPHPPDGPDQDGG